MCGISGIISPDKIDIATLVKMNKQIRHRGPDDEGFVFFGKALEAITAKGDDTSIGTPNSTYKYIPSLGVEDIKGDYFIAFGHRRLSILDLSSAGHMPMCDSHEELWITYNGEVYNFIEIRSELVKLGYQFSTTTDTEVILTAYREWGVTCLDRFMGMFAFAILDKRKNELFFARDRFGIKPFYYWISNSGNLYFGSEIKEFMVSKEWDPKLNHQRAFDYLYGSKTDHTCETMFKGVYQILPGHAISINLTNYKFKSGQLLNTFKWYNPVITEFQGTFKEAKQLFKDKFYQSVKMHLRADVEVGCTLSGGLDSSSITCVVNELLKDEGKADIQNTFSAIDGDSKYSEKKWIEKVLRERKVKSHFITPTPDEILNNINNIVFQMDEPMGSMSPYLAFLVDRCAKVNNITVLLNGQGADEYLGGYGAFRKIQKQQALDSLNLVKIKKEFDCSYVNAIKLGIRSSLRQLYALLFMNSYRRKFGNSLGSKKWYNFLDYKILEISNNHNIRSGLSRDDYRKISENQLTKSPLPMFLRWEDRNSMVHSIEARVPFLDHRLVEFCHSLPIEYIDTNGKTKRVLLEAMKGIIPDEIYYRRDKMGYVAPEERWVKEEYTEKLKELLIESIKFSKGIIKNDAIDYFEDIISGKEKFNYVYWRFIMFGYWMKVFRVSIS